MKDKILIAVIAIAAFLLGTLMPRSSKVEMRDVVVYRDTSYSRLSLGDIKKLDVPEVKAVPMVVYVPETEVKIEYRDSIRYVVLDREHKILENPDVKIWYSGVEPTIDSIAVRTRTVVQKEPWKRHTIGLEGDAGLGLSAGAIYEYDIFKWFSVSAKAGYDFHVEKPYVAFGAEIRLYSW